MCQSFSPVQLFVTPWTVTHKAPLSMEFSRQGYWSGLPFPSPGDLPNPGIKLRYPAPKAGYLPSEPPGKPKTCTDTTFKIIKHITASEIPHGRRLYSQQTIKVQA